MLDRKIYPIYNFKFIYLVVYRLDYYLQHSNIKLIRLYFLTSLIKRFLEIILKVEIANYTLNLYAKGGLYLNHCCKVIFANIGEKCTINAFVNIGATGKRRSGDGSKYPKIGNNCIVGANATILGPIIIGDNVTIGGVL